MDNCGLFIDQNTSSSKPKRILLEKGTAHYNYPSDKLDLAGIKRILTFITGIMKRYRGIHIPMHINMGQVTTTEKLPITLLECIMYDLIVQRKYTVTISFHVQHNIFNECIKYSPLLLLGTGVIDDVKKYGDAFRKDMKLNHYRNIVPPRAAEDGTLCVILGDISYFFAHQSIDDKYCNSLAEMVSELVGNASEHDKSSCLVDIDVSIPYKKNGAPGTYKGINVSLVSFTNIEFWYALQEKITNGAFTDGRYGYVKQAYDRHKDFFCESYTCNDFFYIAAFQDRITSRADSIQSGGTGLTVLLKTLEELSDADNCYLLSGSRMLHFLQEFLDCDSEGWVGFNRQKNFLNFPPDWSILQKSPVTMPGTAYNLNFVCRVGE